MTELGSLDSARPTVAVFTTSSSPLPQRRCNTDCQGISLRVKPNQEIGIRKNMKHFVKHILWLLSRSYRYRLIVRRVS